jgi:hypothetical protein
MIRRLSRIEHPPRLCVWWASDAGPAHRSVTEIRSGNGKVYPASGVNSQSYESRAFRAPKVSALRTSIANPIGSTCPPYRITDPLSWTEWLSGRL